ncbi:MAG: HD domain-containing protein [Pseudomonadota bacterium]
MSSAPDWATRFEAILRERLGPDGSHDLGHFRRVWRMAQEIAAEEGGDREVLAAAAWFHDLVNPPKDSPDRSRGSALSAEAAAPVLLAEGFPKEKLPAVRHAIIAHSFSAGIAPETLEARILQDADRLDALGAIGIARMFYVAGRMGSSLFHPDDPLASDRPLDDRAFSLDHLQTKLFPIAETMNTATGRRIAAKRAALMRSFVGDLVAEI